MNVAESLVDLLIRAGTRRVYGVPGDSLNPLTDAIRRNPALGWVTVRHEETGAFAAGAEAQLSGQLAACAGSCGPGALHLINGLYDAHRSYAPVLAIAAQIPSSEIGMSYFQETHPERLFQDCSHYCEQISGPGQMPRVVQLAIQTAISQGGVSVVALPGDVAAMQLSHTERPQTIVTSRPIVRPIDADLDRLATILNSAKRVTLFCGAGCASARDDVVALARLLAAPVGYAFRGKQFLEYENPNAVGMSGLLGAGAAYKAMHECDVLLLLGTDFPYDEFMPTRPTIAQVDLRAEHLGRRSHLDLGVCGDVGATIHALLPRLRPKQDTSFLEAMLRHHQEAQRKLGVYVRHVSAHHPIHPELLAATLDELANDDAIFTVDTGMSSVWAARYLHATKERRLLGSFTHGSMANAMPQAIGAQFCYPDRQVISLSGDGGFAMLMGDFLTLSQYDLPIKVIVFNNGVLGMVKLEMEVAGLPDWGTNLLNPNFAKLAEAMGVLGVRIEDPGDLRAGLQRALAHPGPALIDVVTDPQALSMPAHVTFKETLGFALAMTKLTLSGHVDEVIETVESNLRNI